MRILDIRNRNGLWRCTRCLALGFIVAISGCGKSGTQQYKVSGNVSYKGKPVPIGAISFEPDSSKGNKGPGVRAEIKNGFYETKEKGLLGGPYRAKIDANDGIPTKIDGEPAPFGKPLISTYEVKVDFPKENSTRDFEVK